ncbi:MAG: sugar ABC transporter permease [Anaerolineales bacterium]|nr:sugar ABC transporter permease [Anaerolineales bacterium]
MSDPARVKKPETEIKGSLSKQRKTQLIMRYTAAGIALIFALFPIIWIISAAFNPSSSMATQSLIPTHASLFNFQELFNNPLHPFLKWIWNSVKVAGITSILAVIITSFTAFAFSRFRFKGRRALLLTILLINVFPAMLAMVALFLMLRQIGEYFPAFGLNTHGGLILVYLGMQMGINIWLMKGFFDSVPRDIDESAMVDGATHWQIFWYLIFPLVRPILAVVAILGFVSAFNEFIIANILLRSTENYTLMVGMYLFISDSFAQDWGVFAAGALIGAVPIAVLYITLQDQIVGGLTSGAVKG